MSLVCARRRRDCQHESTAAATARLAALHGSTAVCLAILATWSTAWPCLRRRRQSVCDTVTSHFQRPVSCTCAALSCFRVFFFRLPQHGRGRSTAVHSLPARVQGPEHPAPSAHRCVWRPSPTSRHPRRHESKESNGAWLSAQMGRQHVSNTLWALATACGRPASCAPACCVPQTARRCR